jgi:hypothetical protein
VDDELVLHVFRIAIFNIFDFGNILNNRHVLFFFFLKQYF